MHGFTTDMWVAMFVATAGVCLGWYLHWLFARRSNRGAEVESDNAVDSVEVRSTSHSDPDQSPVEPRLDVSRNILTQLHDIASGMATDVDEHASRVQAISHELNGLNSSADVNTGVFAAVNKLVEVNAQMQKKLESAEQRLTEQEREIELHASDARTDALTTLGNRRAFDDELAKGYDRFRNNREPISVSLIDVDFFKKFNDTYGHLAGDEVLRGVANVLSNSIGSEGIAVRYGGEEFALIFPGSTLPEIKSLADAARAAIDATTFHFENIELHVTASSGVAELLPGEEIELLVRRADEALYASKEAGRNCGHFNDGEKNWPLREQTDVEPPAESSSDPIDDKTEAVENIDPLSGLPTRAIFCQRVVRYFDKNGTTDPASSIVLLKIDDFDALSSNVHPQASRLALKATYQFVKTIVNETEYIARFDEGVFAMLLPELGARQATNVAERLRQAISRCRLPVGDDHVQFTASFGIAESTSDDSAEQLIERTEATLGAASDNGPNRSFCHDGDSPRSADSLEFATR